MIRNMKIESVWSFLALAMNTFIDHSWKIIILILVIGAVFTGFKIQYGNLNIEKTPIKMEKNPVDQ